MVKRILMRLTLTGIVTITGGEPLCATFPPSSKSPNAPKFKKKGN